MVNKIRQQSACANPFIITFAGVPGSSKTILAYHLSVTFNLPMFSTDNIRWEVREDLQVDNINIPKVLKEFEHRESNLFNQLLDGKVSFICDRSVDRQWQRMKMQLLGAGYSWFLIDMDLSRKFMTKLYINTDRHSAVEELDPYLQQHADFMNNYCEDISLKITDQTFKSRKAVAEKGFREFLAQANG